MPHSTVSTADQATIIRSAMTYGITHRRHQTLRNRPLPIRMDYAANTAHVMPLSFIRKEIVDIYSNSDDHTVLE